MSPVHQYSARVRWTGDRGVGTVDYRSYGRDHEITADGPPPIPGASAPMYRGDRARWNPEQLLLAALAQCHMLSYLHQCADAGVVVTAYEDEPVGDLSTRAGGGRFTGAVLRPRVEVAEEGMVDSARRLHGPASEACFIAASMAFPVRHEPVITVRSS
ncbi:OsmC family protein [Streptomyces calidiresistens]|uniref:OsmC family peroxiredoxin n=1 Tax=Streptomyces calidiresistens TaxID=1485586 RepID=A0A7W3XVX6_9ACTN|nr:OsmC family protein [Streptomyces calidiresistens]MBB0229206.1 OsmC family peroxiredoxin [Streptomyces calidiresistens]